MKISKETIIDYAYLLIIIIVFAIAAYGLFFY